jgi:Family of unknown function (DUF6415)
MPEPTAPSLGNGADSQPLAAFMMRREAQQLIRSVSLLSAAESAIVAGRMRTCLRTLIPATEDMARDRPEGDGARSVALISAGEARRRLDAGRRVLTPEQYAERLARSVVALCEAPDRLAVRRDG